ncbi:MAG: long-chain-fatty-acid--CoA ligase [Deltaproteobacteria bacterium]|nr:long-chain-fatty-acid--CoA ligase [Deltaproteobacteria bacterium]
MFIKEDFPIHLAELLLKATRAYPLKPAVRCHEGVFTYEEFSRRVFRLARVFRDQGLNPGDRVAILQYNCHVFLETYFAAALTDAILVPLNYRLALQEIDFILRDSGSRILIVHSDFAAKVPPAGDRPPALKTVIQVKPAGGETALGPDYETLLAGAPPLTQFALGPGDDAVAQIYYTSGTTGRPKGVMLSHKNVGIHALGTIAELNLKDTDVWIHAAPLFHLADAWATWAITWVGGTHVLVKEFVPATVLETLAREKVTITNMIPTMLNLLINAPGFASYTFPHLRAILSGGAPIAPEVVRKIIEGFHCDYVQTYGMTETSPYLTLSLLKGHLKALAPEEQLVYKAKTGREFIAVSLKVVRENGEEVAPDNREVGEIIVQGDTVTRGYWQLPEETAKAIRDGWLHTGDLAVVDAEGYVNIVDRKKDMILSGGENIYSTEVENILYRHPQVLETAVFGVPDEKWGEAVHACVVLKVGETVSEEELIRFCKDHLAHFKAPKRVTFLDQLPRTGSGKIYKKGLKDPHWQKFDKRVH